MSTDLMPRAEIHALTELREQVLDDLQTAHAALARAEARYYALTNAYISQHERRHLGEELKGKGSEREQLAALVNLDGWAWRRLIDRHGVRHLMSAAQLETFHEQCASAPPPFTLEVITSTLEGLVANAEATFTQSVLDVYRALSGSHRSNDTPRFEKRVILGHAVESWSRSGLMIRWNTRDKLLDLHRVLSILKEGAFSPKDPRWLAFWETHRTIFPGDVLALPHFRIKGHKNGTLHLLFDEEALGLLNRTLATAGGPNALGRAERVPR